MRGFCFKRKTAYELRISDWSSDVCSSDLLAEALGDRPWLAGDFSVADIAMATVLREAIESGAVAEHPTLEAYLARCLARPAFDRALKAQLAAFREEAGPVG